MTSHVEFLRAPLLYLIYINDFRLYFRKTETGHFVDDTIMMFASKKIATIEISN